MLTMLLLLSACFCLPPLNQALSHTARGSAASGPAVDGPRTAHPVGPPLHHQLDGGPRVATWCSCGLPITPPIAVSFGFIGHRSTT
ncbi:MAG: hypothetical protein IRY86_05375 [Thermorudis peleae]|nr:hypothetical protein [Thermorudis peleae]